MAKADSTARAGKIATLKPAQRDTRTVRSADVLVGFTRGSPPRAIGRNRPAGRGATGCQGSRFVPRNWSGAVWSPGFSRFPGWSAAFAEPAKAGTPNGGAWRGHA